MKCTEINQIAEAPRWQAPLSPRHLVSALLAEPPRVVEPVAAVLVGITLESWRPRLLLIQRRRDLRRHPGEVAFPGGLAEPGDSGPAATALREAWEELRVPPQAVRVLGYLPPLRTRSGLPVVPVLALLPPGLRLQGDEQEVDHAFYLPLRRLHNPRGWSRYLLPLDGRLRTSVQFRYHRYRIWGVTARILARLRQACHAPREQEPPA